MQNSSGYVAELKDIQQFMEGIGNQTKDSDSSQGRSRNMNNAMTTNGITTGSGGNNTSGAILNINTASDINIYNNSFIVQSSPPAASSAQKGSLKAQPQISSGQVALQGRHGSSSQSKRGGKNATAS